MDVETVPEWDAAMNREFGESMANAKVAEGKGKTNLRLMNLFIAKTQWDSLVEDEDLEEVVKMASMLTIHRTLLNSQRHHARMDIAMRDELSDMDYPIWIIRRIRNEEGGW